MHGVYRITGLEVTGQHELRVTFDDGTEQVADLSAILEGELYSPLRDARLFAEARIDPETHTVVWPNGADLDPETLHDWPRYRDAMRELAKSWARAGADA